MENDEEKTKKPKAEKRRGSRRKPRFVPKDYAEEGVDLSQYEEEEIRRAIEEVKAKDKRVSLVSRLSVVWTLISTIYTIASTCFLISRRWVDHVFSYVLIGVMVLYVGIFIGLIAFAFDNPKRSGEKAKVFKKLFSILKTFMNIAFIVLAIMQIVALTDAHGAGFLRYLILGVTLLVAVVQLALKLTLLFMRARRKHVAKGYRVRIKRFANGKEKKHSAMDSFKEHLYK